MSSVFDMSAFKHKATRDAFDLSRKNLFSAKVGELLVASCDEVTNGDILTKKPQNFTRTIAVNSAAYTTMREHFDYYFVPTRVLWRSFPSWVTQQLDQTHFAAGPNKQIELSYSQPYFTTKQVHDWIMNLLHVDLPSNINMFGLGRAQNTVKLLQLLGYGDFTPSLNCDAGTDWSALYNDNLTFNPFPLLAYQAICDHFHRNTQWEVSHPYLFNIDYLVGSDVTDMQMQMPDAGNIYTTFFDLQYALYKKDYFFGMYPDTQFGSVSVVDSSGAGNIIGDVHLLSQDGHYPQGGVPYMLTATDDPDWSNGAKRLLISQSISINGQENARGLYSPASGKYANIFISDADIASFNILQLRLAEAKQKWAEVTMSNYYDYVSQIEAHFGVKPDKILSMSPYYVGGYTSTININEVLNTNLTDDNKAEIAGKGVGAGNGEITFDNSKYGNENGYLICLYYCEPLVDYASSGVNRQNLRSLATDYLVPEYENVGMQALYLSELTNAKLDRDDLKGSTVIGYGPRYYDYKTRYDVVNGAFRESLKYWVAPVTDDYINQYFNAIQNPGQVILPKWFRINPHLVDSIFGTDAGDTVDTDCLLINFYEDCKGSRLISRYGLPY